MKGMNARTGAALSGADHIAQSVQDILGTPLGTRIGRRAYGSDLPELLDQPINPLLQVRLYAATALALQRHEKRLRVSRVAFTRGASPGEATIRIVGRRIDITTPDAGVDLSIPVRSLSTLPA